MPNIGNLELSLIEKLAEQFRLESRKEVTVRVVSGEGRQQCILHRSGPPHRCDYFQLELKIIVSIVLKYHFEINILVEVICGG